MSFEELKKYDPCPKCGGKVSRTITQEMDGQLGSPVHRGLSRERIYCNDCRHVFVDREYREESDDG